MIYEAKTSVGGDCPAKTGESVPGKVRRSCLADVTTISPAVLGIIQDVDMSGYREAGIFPHKPQGAQVCLVFREILHKS